MKKVLSLVAILSALVGTASAAPYYLPQPAGGALTPYDWQPVYSFEGIYSFADNDKVPDTYGARINFSLYSNAASSVRHQFGITTGLERGSSDYTATYYGVADTKYDVELTRIPLTLGYDINLGITDSVFIDLGAKAGYAWGTVDTSVKNADGRSFKDNVGGFTFSLGAGIKVQCSDSIYVKAGYEFSRTYFDKVGESKLNFGQHSIVVGVGFTY